MSKLKNLSWKTKLFDWVKRLLPIVFLISVIRYLRNKLWVQKRKTEECELENEYLTNRIDVEEANRDKSDADIVRDALREGRELREPSVQDSES